MFRSFTLESSVGANGKATAKQDRFRLQRLIEQFSVNAKYGRD